MGPDTWTAIFTLGLVLIGIYTSHRQIKAADKVAASSIESQKEITRLNLTLQLIEKYDSESMRSRRRELASSLMKQKRADAVGDQGKYIASVEFVLDILETVGALHQRGWLDKSLTYNSFSYSIVQWWHALETYINDARAKGIDEYYDKFQYLAQTYIDSDHGFKNQTKEEIDAELDEFLQSELS